MRLLALPLLAVLSGPALAGSPVPSGGVIQASGDYYLTENRVGPGPAVLQINAVDVDLDLRGRYVICNPSDRSTAVTIGIQLSGRAHVTIRNGGVWGCYAGVSGNGDYLRLTGVDFSYNTYMGANVSGFGIKITDSVFQAIGGYTVEPYAVAINGLGNGCLVERNTFREIKRQNVNPALGGEGVGILVGANARDCVIRSNWMANREPGAEIGIWLAAGASAFVAENTITNFGEAAVRGSTADGTVENNRLGMSASLPGSIGVRRADGIPTIEARGNVISGFGQALVNVTDGGGNVILP